jgi:hypothetical protein
LKNAKDVSVRKECCFFYEVSPYTVSELVNHVVYELTINNQLISSLLLNGATDDSTTSSPSSGKRLCDASENRQSEEAVVLKEVGLEKRKWRMSHNTTTGLVTICVKVSNSANISHVLEETILTYPELANTPLKLFDVREGRACGFHEGSSAYAIAHSRFNPYLSSHTSNTVSLLELFVPPKDEELCVQVVFYVKGRNSDNAVLPQGLPYLANIKADDKLQDLIDILKTRVAACYPPLEQCPASYISLNNRVTLLDASDNLLESVVLTKNKNIIIIILY